MKIGIKYCGGCNPRYERTRIAAKIMEDFPDSEIVTAGAAKDLDFAVIICGCNSACALHDKLSGRYGKIILTGNKDYARLKEELARRSES